MDKERLVAFLHSKTESLKPKTTITAETFDDFLDIIDEYGLVSVSVRAKTTREQHLEISLRGINRFSEGVMYANIFSSSDGKTTATYTEDYGVLPSMELGTQEQQRAAIATIITARHKLARIKLEFPGVKVTHLNAAAGRPFTEEELSTLEERRKQLGIGPIPTLP